MKRIITNEFKELITLKKTDRTWEVPVLAALSVGVPLLVGLYMGNLSGGLLASLSGLVILYMPVKATFAKRMIVMFTASFGFMASFGLGLLFSFDLLVSSVVFGFFSFVVHYIISYYKIKPPGNFFFIMIGALAFCEPYELAGVPEKLGYVGMGAMGACLLALLFSFYIMWKDERTEQKEMKAEIRPNAYVNMVEAGIIGAIMFVTLLLGHLLKFENPYWIPTSCLAVMQGASRYHIWQRTFHRVLGTFIGLGMCWLLLSFKTDPLYLCLSVMVLQGVIEVLVVRQYALAVIFITPLTIFLAEAADPLLQNPDALITARVVDISIGAAIGAVGGWLLHHEKIRYQTIRKIQKTRIAIKKRKIK